MATGAGSRRKRLAWRLYQGVRDGEENAESFKALDFLWWPFTLFAFWRQQDVAVHLVSACDISCDVSQFSLSPLWPWQGSAIFRGHNPSLHRGIRKDIWTSVVMCCGEMPWWPNIMIHVGCRVTWLFSVVLGCLFLSLCFPSCRLYSEALWLLSLYRKPWWRVAVSETPCATLPVDIGTGYLVLKNKHKSC